MRMFTGHRFLDRRAAVVLGLAAIGCAAWIDDEVHRTFDAERTHEAVAEPPAPPPPEDGRRHHHGHRGDELEGWARVEHLLERATFVLERRPEPEVLARIARRSCKVDPDPAPSDEGWVRVCDPIPPVRIEEHDFVLEVAEAGSIGLVATELSQEDSEALVEVALVQTAVLCARPWLTIPWSEFHTCPTGNGSTLAVGRTASDTASTQWRVFISILGGS